VGLLTDALGAARGAGDHKASESHLRLLKSVVVNANDGVLIAEAKPQDHLGGKIIYVNEAFCRMTGYSGEEAEGRTPRILLGPQTDRDQLNLVRESLSNLAPVRVEIVNYRKDGSAYWVEVSFVPIVDERGEFTHWVAVQRETTDRRRAEDLELDRNRVLELVARNEPLEKILNHLSEMVERQCPDLQCAILLLRDGQMVQAAGVSLPGSAVESIQGVSGAPLSCDPAPIGFREMLPGRTSARVGRSPSWPARGPCWALSRSVAEPAGSPPRTNWI
jgi:PAS domain S-box-containing protein